MRRLAEGIHTWSVFSEQKQMDFNGLHLQLRGGCVLVDPPALTEADAKRIEDFGTPVKILLTNKDHRRAAPAARERFGAPIAIHHLDAPLLDCGADETFAEGERLLEELTVIHLPGGKSPGEAAFHWTERRVLILGDALIGKEGRLAMLPADKYADPVRARAGLQRLVRVDADMVLVGDGQPILESGSRAVAEFLKEE